MFRVAASACAARTAERAATTAATSSLRIERTFLEDGGLGVGAEDRLQGLDDLALGGVYAGALEKVRHQVRVRTGGLAQLGERALDGRSVAAGPPRPAPGGLLA